MSQKLAYTTLDVFTTEKYTGNPLAIVHLPPSLHSLDQSAKQLIAKEFNLSETVFLHEPENPESSDPLRIDIFIVSAEIPFAGHPTVGSGWFLHTRSPASSLTLKTKAGDIPVTFDPSSQMVRLKVPIDFKIHSHEEVPPTEKQTFLAKKRQEQLGDADFSNKIGGEEPVVSIVKGMTFVLLQLTSEGALARMGLFQPALAAKESHLGQWNGAFLGVYAFYIREDGVVRTRMFDGGLEDPATGSAASALAGWLAKTQKGPGEWTFDILQGVEMGRKSEIRVVVKVKEGGEIGEIYLSGRAVKVMEGFLEI